MTASERVNLIKEIASIMGSEDWSLIDLTLRQFNFETLETFNGDSFHYLLQQLESGQESDIISLATHLNIELNTKESDLNPGFWREGYFKLFISHLSSEKIRANDLKDELENYAISGFVAHTDIEPTKEWQSEIEIALRTCDALLAMMTPKFHEGNWTDQEIGIAFGRDLLIVPVRLGRDPYGFIGKFQAITDKRDDLLAEELFTSLVKNKKTNKKMAYALMTKFENSNTYAEAKRNIALVKKIEYWDDKLIERLKQSKDNNSQIRGSFGVPGSIEHLLGTLIDR
jgi:hypothetical protein